MRIAIIIASFNPLLSGAWLEEILTHDKNYFLGFQSSSVWSMAGSNRSICTPAGELVSILFCLEHGWKNVTINSILPPQSVSILFCLEHGWKAPTTNVAIWSRMVSILFCLEHGWKPRGRRSCQGGVWFQSSSVWSMAGSQDCFHLVTAQPVSILFCLEHGWKLLQQFRHTPGPSFNPLLSGAWLEAEWNDEKYRSRVSILFCLEHGWKPPPVGCCL